MSLETSCCVILLFAAVWLRIKLIARYLLAPNPNVISVVSHASWYSHKEFDFFESPIYYSFGNTANHVVRTRRQLNAIHRSDKDLKQTDVSQLFAKSPNNSTLLYLLGKALADKNDEFNGLGGSKIENVDAYLDVLNRAVDEQLNSVINLTIVLRASKPLEKTKPTPVTPHKSLIHPTPSVVKGGSKKGGTLNTFEKSILDTHNAYRKKHGVQPLTFSADMSKVSQNWAEFLADNELFEHRPEGQYGENIYVIESSEKKFKITGNMPVDAWYSEIVNYTFTAEPSLDVIMRTGHFTQLVWKTSKELGIGLARSKASKPFITYYVVCNYNPRGNMVGEFKGHVNSLQKMKRN